MSTRLISARKIAKLVGSIISTKFVLGDITSLKTRYLYELIEDCPSWDSKVDISDYPNGLEEIKFWRDNIHRLNRRTFTDYRGCDIQVASDASSMAIGIVISELNLKAHRNLSESEIPLSSTWRELQAIVYGLKSFNEIFSSSFVYWSTDNFAPTSIVRKGSKKILFTFYRKGRCFFYVMGE